MDKAAKLILDYLTKYKMSYVDFCKLTGVSRAALHCYINENRRMKPFMAKRIEKNTGGNLKASDLID